MHGELGQTAPAGEADPNNARQPKMAYRTENPYFSEKQRDDIVIYNGKSGIFSHGMINKNASN